MKHILSQKFSSKTRLNKYLVTHCSYWSLFRTRKEVQPSRPYSKELDVYPILQELMFFNEASPLLVTTKKNQTSWSVRVECSLCNLLSRLKIQEWALRWAVDSHCASVFPRLALVVSDGSHQKSVNAVLLRLPAL